MKKLMMMGGLLGFGIGVGSGLVKEVSWPALFWRACVTALLAGWLFRWWGRVWLRSLQDSRTFKATSKSSSPASVK